MSALEIVFWIAALVVFYTFLGYGIVIAILARASKREEPAGRDTPEVTLLVAAWNEAAFIEEKIRNCLELDYPPEKLRLLFVDDGSDDGTPEILARHERVTLLRQPARRGKIAALNAAMPQVATPIVVLSDVNALLNRDAIRAIVRHHADRRVGAVAGDIRIWREGVEAAAASGEGIYWRYESWLKQKDSAWHTAVGAAGALFSMRTALWEPVEEDSIIEDFVVSLRIAARGHRVVFEPGAHATEPPSASIAEEWKRKVRICAGGFQAIARLRALLNPSLDWRLTFQYVSHRVLRWAVAPFLLPVLFVLNIVLARSPGGIYAPLLVFQAAFYLVALAGWVLQHRRLRAGALFVPFYFTMMNAAAWAGLARFLRGAQPVTWERARRG